MKYRPGNFLKVQNTIFTFSWVYAAIVVLLVFHTSHSLFSVEAEYNINSLNAYEMATNRSYKFHVDHGTYYLRVGRETPEEIGINRKEEIKHYLVAEKIGLAPKLYGYNIESGMLITEYIHGVAPSEERIHDHQLLRMITRNLQQLHSYPSSQSQSPENTVFRINDRLLKKAKEVREDHDLAKWLKIRNSFEKGYYDDIPLGLCHADLFRGNILINEDTKVYFIDWEYSYYGHVIDDLGKLCSANWLTSEEMKNVSKLYWGKDDHSLVGKLAQNIFIQQINFFLWCHIQAETQSKDASVYLSFAEMVREHLNQIGQIQSWTQTNDVLPYN